jgi:hypothetical protein
MRPSKATPPPIPVPAVTKIHRDLPFPAPQLASPSAEAFASFSRATVTLHAPSQVFHRGCSPAIQGENQRRQTLRWRRKPRRGCNSDSGDFDSGIPGGFSQHAENALEPVRVAATGAVGDSSLGKGRSHQPYPAPSLFRRRQQRRSRFFLRRFNPFRSVVPAGVESLFDPWNRQRHRATSRNRLRRWRNNNERNHNQLQRAAPAAPLRVVPG